MELKKKYAKLKRRDFIIKARHGGGLTGLDTPDAEQVPAVYRATSTELKDKAMKHHETFKRRNKCK